MQRVRPEEIEALVVKGDKDSLALAISGLNITLAHHAAWTEERFGEVVERLDSVDRSASAIDRRLGTFDISIGRMATHQSELSQLIDFIRAGADSQRRRIDEIDVAQAAMQGRLGKVESRQVRFENEQQKWQVKVDEKLEYLKSGHYDVRLAIKDLQAGQSRLEEGQANLKSTMDERFHEMDQRFDKVDERFDRLTGWLRGEFSTLGARLDEVLGFAAKDELKVREVNE